LPVSTDVDVVIVGAGPAGLACASALAGSKLQLLERQARHGGRIQTIELARQRVDMGACFAFDASVVPAGSAVETGRMVQERSVLCVRAGDQTTAAATPRGCLVRMGIDGDTLAKIDAVARRAVDATTLVGTRAYSLLDALLHQVHPGELRDYAPQHQRDGLFTWYPDHWELGNATLTDALLERSGADLRLGTEVTRVADLGDHVEVEFRSAGVAGRLSARTAVIATTADVAASLAEWPALPLRRFLAATRYAGYLVVALAGPAWPALAEFRCMVPLGGSPALVVQQRTYQRDRAALLSYYRGDQLAQFGACPDAELAGMCRSHLCALGIDAAALEALSEYAVARWASAGTILSGGYLQARASAATFGSANIFLAGDYACGESGVGYGIADAIRSGLHAARQVQALLAR